VIDRPVVDRHDAHHRKDAVAVVARTASGELRVIAIDPPRSRSAVARL